MISKFIIRLVQCLGRRKPMQQVMFQHNFRNHHEESCRNALPRNIRNQKGDMVIIDKEVIVKVATDFKRRAHHSIIFKALDFKRS